MSPSMPKQPLPPPPPPPPPTMNEAQESRRVSDESMRRRGRAATVLTDTMSQMEPASSATKKLLGG
jgi:hypothetical protein